MPHAVFECPGLVVVHKPPGWEVDAEDVGLANDLCIWLQSILPEKSHPVMHDKERPLGFAHRLDVTCSGLLLAAVNFESYALLKWQFSGGVLMREYMVFCHGPVSLKLREVEAHILHYERQRKCKAEVSTYGAPSRTSMTVQAHGTLSS